MANVGASLKAQKDQKYSKASCGLKKKRHYNKKKVTIIVVFSFIKRRLQVEMLLLLS